MISTLVVIDTVLPIHTMYLLANEQFLSPKPGLIMESFEAKLSTIPVISEIINGKKYPTNISVRYRFSLAASPLYVKKHVHMYLKIK